MNINLLQPLQFNRNTHDISAKSDCAKKDQANLSCSLNNYCYPQIYFTGLSRKLGKKAYSTNEEIRKEIKRYPNANGVVGSIPSEWIELIPKSERKDKIKSFYGEMGQIVKKLRSEGQDEDNIEKASKQIGEAIVSAGILKQEEAEKLSIKKLGSGLQGSVYLLDEGRRRNRFVIKVYHHTKPVTNEGHGVLLEANQGYFWLQNAGRNTQKSRFYYGDLLNGYTMCQFVDINTPSPKRSVSEELLGTKYDDTHKHVTLDDRDNDYDENVIAGYDIDWGGYSIINPVLAEYPAARDLNKRLKDKSPEECLNIFNDSFDNRKNNKDILIPLTVMLGKIPDDKRTDCFLKLANKADYPLKRALIWHLDNVPESDRSKCFKKLMYKADNFVKMGLAEKTMRLPIEDRDYWYKVLAFKADNNIKEVLASKLPLLPDNKQAYWFKQLAINADNAVKKQLAVSLHCIGSDERFFWFKKLAINSNNSVKKALTGKLCCILDENKRIRCFSILARNSTNAVKEELATRLYTLPKEKRAYWFKQLANDSSNSVKMALARGLHDIPENKRAGCFRKLADNANSNLMEVLSYYTNVLPEKHQDYWNKRLAVK